MIQVKSPSPQNFKIWTEELTKIYGIGFNKITAVDHINLLVKSGVHGFLGPNGAGKTTTINVLIGAISKTKGEAKVLGKDAGSIAAKRKIGFLPQDPTPYGNMKGFKYLVHMAKLSGKKKQWAKQKAEELLNFFNLKDFSTRKIKTYSKGMKQKISVAGSLMGEPELLIFDEPTGNLDPKMRAKLIEKIKELSKELTVFVSSHILSEIEQMCDTVTIINKGKIVLTDTVQNLQNLKDRDFNSYIIDTTNNQLMKVVLEEIDFVEDLQIRNGDNKISFLVSDSQDIHSLIPKLMSQNNIGIIEFSENKYSLQDIYLKLIKDKSLEG